MPAVQRFHTLLSAIAGERITYRIEPVCVQNLLSIGALGHQHSPLPTKFAGRILPLWLYALLEQVEVCAGSKPARWLDVVVQAADAHNSLAARTGNL